MTIRGRVLPAWGALLLVWGASRVFTSLMFVLVYLVAHNWSVASYAQGNPALPPAMQPTGGFMSYLSAWDVQWYAAISVGGYPHGLPLDAAGDVRPNQWAFLPLYPYFVRLITILIGAPSTLNSFAIVGGIISMIFGGLAMLALHRALLQVLTPTRAFWGAVIFAVVPVSFVLQLAYAESFYLFFFFCALAAMLSRRYMMMIPFAMVASFSHPGALALAAAIGMQGLALIWNKQKISWAEGSSALLAMGSIVAATFVWPFLAALLTGDPSAYFDTETAWWRLTVDGLTFIPFLPFFALFKHLLGWPGAFLIAGILLASGLWAIRRKTRLAYGLELWTHGASYALYLVAVFFPTQSIFRMVLPLTPMLAHPGLTESRRGRIITIAIALALTPLCIEQLWIQAPP